MSETADPNVHHDTVEAHTKLFRDLLLGFVRVHVLHHVDAEPSYGVGLLNELETHGYRLSPGTLYPLLHNLEAAGFLEREERVIDGKIRKYYEITTLGELALRQARERIRDLAEDILGADFVPSGGDTGS